MSENIIAFPKVREDRQSVLAAIAAYENTHQPQERALALTSLFQLALSGAGGASEEAVAWLRISVGVETQTIR